MCVFIPSPVREGPLYEVPGPPHGGSFNHIGLFKLELKTVRRDHEGPNLDRFQNTLHSAAGCPIKESPDSKFNFSAHMNTMQLLFLGGLHKMCMFHEPEGFWPTIFLHTFLGALKIHCPVSPRERLGNTSEEKVNWSTFNFTATSREHTLCENARIFRKSLPKSEKNGWF